MNGCLPLTWDHAMACSFFTCITVIIFHEKLQLATHNQKISKRNSLANDSTAERVAFYLTIIANSCIKKINNLVFQRFYQATLNKIFSSY